MPGSRPTLQFVRTDDIEPQVFRLYIALFPIGTGSVCHWGLVIKDSTGATYLLDVNDVSGSRKHEVRDFNRIRKNHLKIICEIARLEDDEWVHFVRTTAAAEEFPMSGDSFFCRTWVMSVLKTLKRNHVNLYGDPKTIQRAVQHAVGEFDMQYGPEYYVLAPLR
ncbi:hypothetical protein F4823DRAFT_636359 [Ustulina deusta]|nr:hypothetical protein F4823DRAFT_636359 [Ustulina deusta]